MKIDVANCEHGDNQDNPDHNHQDIGVAGRGDERWQMMGGGGVKRLAQATLRSQNTTSRTDWRPGSIFAQ